MSHISVRGEQSTQAEIAVLESIASLGDPGANRILGWDETDNDFGWFALGVGLSYDHATRTLSASGGGGLSDGDYGDVTVSGSGTVITIDNDVVTYAKMQNVSATDRILGRSTAGAGDVEEIVCTSFARNILDDANAAAVIATLGLDADLATFSLPASTTISAFGATLVDDADASAARTTLGLVIGTDVQAFDADLTTWAGITPGTGVGTALAVNVGSAGAFVVNGGALGTPASGTVTNLTGTASININGTVGATTPAAGTFTEAVANSFVPNSASVPSNGLYLPAANTLGWAVNSAAEMQLTASALSPAVSDGNALGTTSLMWADLFLASGGVINWNNGDVTVTHAANSLAFAGASSGYTFDAAVAPATNDGAALGTTSLGWADLYLATGGNILVNNANARRSIVLSAAGMWPSTTSGAAANVKVEYATNDQDLYHLDFDQTSDEFAQATVAMPDNWDGSTVTAVFYWTANSTSTNSVVWAIQGRAYADGDAVDAAWGTAQTVTDANGASANTVRISAATADVTVAGSPAGGQLVQFRIYRDADNGSDNLAADARLIAVKIEYGISGYSD